MTDFGTLRVSVGRKPITIVELDLDYCQNTYGVAPCTAAVGVTGAQKCFNTFKTCQDSLNFLKGTKTYRFATESPLLPVGENLIPCITDVDVSPTQVNPEGFSVSASVTVTLKDFPHHDRGFDPYYAERAYRPQEQGTFFGRFRGRNPYLINRVMRLNTGYVDATGTLYTMQRTYFIDRMEGPDASGTVKLYGKDVLRFADAEKAQVPVASPGKLAGVLDIMLMTSFTLTPAGSGASYPTAGIVRIEDELIAFTGRSGDVISGLTRGAFQTTAAAHAAATTVQLCVRYDAQTIPAILSSLLTTYAGISASYITMADWTAEANQWLPGFTSSVILSKPTGVKAIYEDLLQSTGCALWWDEESAQVRFKVIVPFVPSGAVKVLNDRDHILVGSMQVKDREKDRLSRVLVYFSPISQIADMKRENMRSVYVDVGTTGEGANAYGVTNQREIISRWIPDLVQSAKVTARLLARYEETPREVTFRVDAKDMMKVGSLFDLESRLIQGPDGLPQITRFFVTEAGEAVQGTHYEYTALQISRSGGGQASLITPDAMQDWTAASATSKSKYMFISDEAGVMSDLKPAPKIA